MERCKKEFDLLELCHRVYDMLGKQGRKPISILTFNNERWLNDFFATFIAVSKRRTRLNLASNPMSHRALFWKVSIGHKQAVERK